MYFYIDTNHHLWHWYLIIYNVFIPSSLTPDNKTNAIDGKVNNLKVVYYVYSVLIVIVVDITNLFDIVLTKPIFLLATQSFIFSSNIFIKFKTKIKYLKIVLF